MKGAILEDSNLRGADLRKAGLGGSNLKGANLTKARLRGASFEEEVSWWKYPRDSAPRDTDKSAVNMLGVILKEAEVSGVDLSMVHSLSLQQIQHACGDSTTKLPSGFTHPSRWPNC